ncbi:hypothetical protein L0P88_13680 [Muricauda sp. SCSIO 64092]|uniref:hypothetical protein n=1 Tax=Allomuricauda sp. SCSIO 64092 TaxID=2908842 RepID=UPI001FF38DD5|nr:hypothetical protein [Muricauda sp. SCSIO 64092]UOY05002.1 hypothetical protein L0P88_13680 [Muricauda sp. SCSIO 64092]
MNDKVIIDVLIENIKTDTTILEEVDQKLEPLQQEKRDVMERIKDHKQDVSVLIKYADDQSKEELESLGFVLPYTGGLNPVASIALEVLVKSKEKKMTNDGLHKAYVKVSQEREQEPVGYSDFNIKCRPLFNSQKFIRTKGKDPKSSKGDIISLTGRVATAQNKENDGKAK